MNDEIKDQTQDYVRAGTSSMGTSATGGQIVRASLFDFTAVKTFDDSKVMIIPLSTH